MSVVANRSGTNAVVTITTDVADILTQAGVSNAEKRRQSLQRVAAEILAAIDAAGLTDAEIDAQATVEYAVITARVVARKAARPTGSL